MVKKIEFERGLAVNTERVASFVFESCELD